MGLMFILTFFYLFPLLSVGWCFLIFAPAPHSFSHYRVRVLVSAVAVWVNRIVSSFDKVFSIRHYSDWMPHQSIRRHKSDRRSCSDSFRNSSHHRSTTYQQRHALQQIHQNLFNRTAHHRTVCHPLHSLVPFQRCT